MVQGALRQHRRREGPGRRHGRGQRRRLVDVRKKADLVRRPLVSVGVDDSSSSRVVARRVAPPIRAVVLKRRPQALDDRLESEGLVAPGGEEGVELEAGSTPVVVGVVVDDYCSAERRLADARRPLPAEAYTSLNHTPAS